jgi:hypothetical protein
MNPDQAAEMLQVEERGIDLLKKVNENEKLAKAIQQVQAGFAPADVAQLYGLDWDPEQAGAQSGPTGEFGAINVWECKTQRCRQKGRVSTASNAPRCPSCGQEMTWVMEVMDEGEIGHMRRTFVPDPGLRDPLSRTDKTNAPDFAMGDFDD